MQINIHLSGTITVVHKMASDPGNSPPATLADLNALGEKIMSVLTDKIAAEEADLNSSLDEATARVQGDVADLNKKIADLQSTVDSGGASPDDLAALDAAKERLRARIDAIDPASPTTLPTPNQSHLLRP